MKTPHMYSFALNRAQADASPLARASRRLALFAFAVLLASHSAQGATNRFSTGTSWNVPSDWSLGTTPTSGDALLFSTVAPATTTLDNSFTADTLSFNTPNTMAIDANASGTTAQTLTLNNTTTDANGFNDIISLLGNGTINFGVTASKGVLTLALTASTNNIDVANSSSLVFGSSSTISGASSAVSFNGNTSGRLTLSAANTFSGFTLTSGRVTALNTTALGVSTGILTLNGGTLDLRGTPNTTIAENYNTVVGGNAIIETGVTSAGVASTHTLGTLSIGAATLTVNKGANVTSGRPRVSFGGTTLTGNATFATGGNATLLLGNGAATVPTGNFNMSFQSADGTGASIIRGAATSSRSSGTTTLTSGLLSFNANANAQPLGTVNSSNVLVLNGGLLALQMSTQIGAYNTTVGGNAQILVDSNNAVTVGFTQTFGTLSIGSNTLTVSGLNGSATAYGLVVVATSGTTGAAFGATTLAGNPIFNVTNTANAGTAVSQLNLGALTDGGTVRTITKTGDATLALTANATSLVNGTQLNISAGNVSVNATTALGTLAAVDVADGATFTLGANQTIGALTNTSTTSNTGSVVLGSNTLTVGSTNNLASSFSGTISGGGALTKGGSNTFTLSGSNSYTGTTTVNAGSLAITSGGSLASGNALTVGASGTANFANAGQTLGAVSNANTATNALNFSAATGTVTLASLSGAGNTRFGSNGTVTGGISTGTVNAVGLLTSDISGGTVGAGSLTGSTVSGGTNTITGAAGITTLSNGTTTVGGAATIGTMSGGTAYLNGTSAITNLNGGTVNLGSTVLSVAGGTTSGTIAGSGGSINKIGGTTLTLSGNNTYGGGTTLTSGTLVLDHNSAAGTAGITVSGSSTLQINSLNTIVNSIVFSNASAAINRQVAASGSYNVGTSGNLTSSLGGTPTTAKILAGTNNGTMATLTMSFAKTPVAANNDLIRLSDVFSLSGVTNVGGNQTNLFVLQLNASTVTDTSILGWLNSSDNWVNAVSGNTGGTPNFVLGAYTNQGLGSYGVDVTNHNVWAVLDHNSNFAVIPEPTTWALLAFSLTTVTILRRRRA